MQEPSRTSTSRSLLLGAAAVLSGVDWLFPLRDPLSFGISGALTVLALPWTFALLRPDPAGSPARAGRLLWLARIAAFGLLAAFLAAKWQMLLRATNAPGDFVAGYKNYTLAAFVAFAIGTLVRSLRLARFVRAAADQPARLMALSFGITGLLGALMLSLPFSTREVHGVSLVDNLFMSFSAVCVTGLSVNNLADTYSITGQVVLCALIQVGGLGIMVLSAAISILAGQKLRMKSSAVLAEMVDVSSLKDVRRTIVGIVTYTLALETAGAFLLYFHFARHPEIATRFGSGLSGAGDPRWAAIFHAVSGFCNAGFSNFQAGLGPLVGSPVVMLTVSCLIVLGGIGFPVLDELVRSALTRLSGKRATAFSLHTRIALRTTALLFALLALVLFALEWRHSMKDLSVGERVLASIFQSASARTAGFNVVDIGKMHVAVLVLTCAAMFIGACPGGTGGGIKTTTLAVLYAGLRSELVARSARLLDRRVPFAVIRRASGVAFMSMVIVFSVFFLLVLFEPHEPLSLVFETVSAFSTTGLSTGITPTLSTPGKLLVTFTMFIGRIGPLTLALAFARAVEPRTVEPPEERVMIG
jgi:trk system potassium uptake protein